MSILKTSNTGKLALGVIVLFCSMIFMTSCEKDSKEIIEDTGLSLDDLYGKWSMTNETEIVTDVSGTEVSNESEQWGHNFKTLEFKDNGKFLFISVKEAEWSSGDFTLDAAVESLELDFGSELVSANIEKIDATSATFKIVEQETQGSETLTTTTTITMVRNTGIEPGINATDLTTKWSMVSNKVYVNNLMITSEVINEKWMETEATIADDMYTLELKSDNSALNIDNYMTGLFDNGEFEVLDASNFVVELEGQDDPILFHITGNNGSGGLSVIHYQENDNTEVKVEQDWKSSFTATSIDATQLAGSWEVTATTDSKEIDGEEATADSEGLPPGSIVLFNADGSGTAGESQFTFEFLDESNMVLTFPDDPDSALVHFETFNGTNQVTMYIMDSEWNNGSFEQSWFRMDLTK